MLYYLKMQGGFFMYINDLIDEFKIDLDYIWIDRLLQKIVE